MAAPELAPPRNVVPAHAVDVVVRAVRFELTALQDELRRASAQAAEVERAVDAQHQLEPVEDTALERRLQTFLDDWLRHEEDQLRGLMDVAQARADSRVQLAEIEAAAILEAARADSLRDLVVAPEPEPPLRLLSNALEASPVAHRVPDEHASEEQIDDASSSGQASSWLDDALAALERDDPAEALGALAALAGPLAAVPAGEELADDPAAVASEPAAAEPSATDVQRVAASDEGPPSAIAEAEPDELYAKFWQGEQDAEAARERARAWAAPLQVLLPVLVVLLVLVLAGLWIA